MQRSHSNPVLALALLAALALSSLIDIGLRVKAIAKLLWFRRQRRDDTASDEERDREDRRRSLAAERIDWVGSSNKGSDKFAEKWKRALLKDLGASWHYWAILCHLFCIAYVGIAVCEVFEATVTSSTAVAKRLLLGCACFTSSLQFLGFLRFFPRVYFLIKVTRRSMPKVLSMLAAAVPIFVGSVCFATIVFGSALSSGDDGSRGEFDTFSSTATALFTATFGDSLLAAFRTTQRDSGGGSDGIGRWIQRSIGGVFIVLYVFVFMSVVLNVALAIVMETFGELRETFGVAVLDHSPDCNDRDGDERVQGANEAAAQKVLDGLEELVAYSTFPEATTRD
jgi:hypothetical protein